MGVCVYCGTTVVSFAIITWKGEELFIRILNRWKQERNIHNRRILEKVSKRGAFLALLKSPLRCWCRNTGFDTEDYDNNTHIDIYKLWDSVQFSSVAQSFLSLCNPMDCSTPDLPVHHQLSEFTQAHVHWVGDAIQPPHPLLSPSPPTFNLSQNQGLFQWVSFLHQVAKVLEFQLQHQPFQWIFSDFL